MSEKFRLDRKIGVRNTFYTKCINVIIDSIGPSIILMSIYKKVFSKILMGQSIAFKTLKHALFVTSQKLSNKYDPQNEIGNVISKD